MAEPGADGREDPVEGFLGRAVVETEHERVSEPALVRGVRGAQRGVGGRVPLAGPARGMRAGLARERFREVGVGEVVRRLVGRGQQGLQIAVGPVRGEPLGPAVAGAAAEEGGQRVGRGGGVQPHESGGRDGRRSGRGGPLLGRYGGATGRSWKPLGGQCCS